MTAKVILELADEIAKGDFEDRGWMIDALDRARAALLTIGTPPTGGWEYSIAYPQGDGWTTDGAEVFETHDAAEVELDSESYLAADRIVRRRPAGPWEVVPDGHAG
ncbi:hypothetical protein GCM10009775_04480 [Microbacterium aoyamense]|uniref:Immunity protein 35 n=1 Tax=Microbacterium aoyamense TaxID=344166 RepID=A0ABP5AJA1_9MICO|nr:hypothetical protein [Microbacterium aoyamense]